MLRERQHSLGGVRISAHVGRVYIRDSEHGADIAGIQGTGVGRKFLIPKPSRVLARDTAKKSEEIRSFV
jgi:hypothetical protein